ncbi:MAG: hypothetical protein OXC10_07255 [Rhodospirillaceae bacterium]|nr:hypothetical protein [Rhodospirillaceae bacterium]
MSIINRIEDLVRDGRLSHIEPLDHSLAVKRNLLVSVGIRELIEGPWQSKTVERRAYRLRADLEAFAVGHVLGVSMTPYQHNNAYMGLLNPPERGFWDIRSRDPNPGLRVFGHFAAVDLFVALVWHPRSLEVDGRLPLGDNRGLNWEIAKLQCEEAWNSLFPNDLPKIGEKIGEFISENRILV